MRHRALLPLLALNRPLGPFRWLLGMLFQGFHGGAYRPEKTAVTY